MKYICCNSKTKDQIAENVEFVEDNLSENAASWYEFEFINKEQLGEILNKFSNDDVLIYDREPYDTLRELNRSGVIHLGLRQFSRKDVVEMAFITTEIKNSSGEVFHKRIKVCYSFRCDAGYDEAELLETNSAKVEIWTDKNLNLFLSTYFDKIKPVVFPEIKIYRGEDCITHFPEIQKLMDETIEHEVGWDEESHLFPAYAGFIAHGSGFARLGEAIYFDHRFFKTEEQYNTFKGLMRDYLNKHNAKPWEERTKDRGSLVAFNKAFEQNDAELYYEAFHSYVVDARTACFIHEEKRNLKITAQKIFSTPAWDTEEDDYHNKWITLFDYFGPLSQEENYWFFSVEGNKVHPGYLNFKKYWVERKFDKSLELDDDGKQEIRDTCKWLENHGYVRPQIVKHEDGTKEIIPVKEEDWINDITKIDPIYLFEKFPTFWGNEWNVSPTAIIGKYCALDAFFGLKLWKRLKKKNPLYPKKPLPAKTIPVFQGNFDFYSKLEGSAAIPVNVGKTLKIRDNYFSIIRNLQFFFNYTYVYWGYHNLEKFVPESKVIDILEEPELIEMWREAKELLDRDSSIMSCFGLSDLKIGQQIFNNVCDIDYDTGKLTLDKESEAVWFKKFKKSDIEDFEYFVEVNQGNANVLRKRGYLSNLGYMFREKYKFLSKITRKVNKYFYDKYEVKKYLDEINEMFEEEMYDLQEDLHRKGYQVEDWDTFAELMALYYEQEYVYEDALKELKLEDSPYYQAIWEDIQQNAEEYYGTGYYYITKKIRKDWINSPTMRKDIIGFVRGMDLNAWFVNRAFDIDDIVQRGWFKSLLDHYDECLHHRVDYPIDAELPPECYEEPELLNINGDDESYIMRQYVLRNFDAYANSYMFNDWYWAQDDEYAYETEQDLREMYVSFKENFLKAKDSDFFKAKILELEEQGYKPDETFSSVKNTVNVPDYNFLKIGDILAKKDFPIFDFEPKQMYDLPIEMFDELMMVKTITLVNLYKVLMKEMSGYVYNVLRTLQVVTTNKKERIQSFHFDEMQEWSSQEILEYLKEMFPKKFEQTIMK